MVSTKNVSSAVLIPAIPIFYMFLGVFITRTEIKLFFGMALIMLLAQAFLTRLSKLDGHKSLAVALITLSAIGLTAASVLTIEKIELLEDPQHVTSCSVSPIVSCSPIIASEQASAFAGVANPILGIFGFACVFAAGMTLLAGAVKLKKAWWLALLGGTVFGIVFSGWLINAGIYEIGALCLYCMSVWIVSFSLFWLVLAEILKQRLLPLPKSFSSFIVRHRDALMTVTIGVIILMIYFRWSDYWNGLL